MVAAVPKTPPAVLVTIPAIFNPVIVAPLKVGASVFATDCPIEMVLPPDKITPVPAASVVCLLLNKFQSVAVKYPLEAAVAAEIEIVFDVLRNGKEKVNGFSKSVPPIAAETTPEPFAFNMPALAPAPPWLA